MCVYLFTGILELDDSNDCVEPTRECRRICNKDALPLSLSSGSYPEYLGIEGPQDHESLCDLIVDETNSYGRSKPNWLDIDRDELLTLVGLITMMGINKLPRIENYWSASLNFCCELPSLKRFMSSHRFWKIWSNLDVVVNSTLSGNGLTRKFKPILDVLSRTFLSNYSPSQELSVDEAMIKCKGHIRGKVRMPNKPIKVIFKV